MKYIKTFEQLFEKRLTIKRKYTESYPAKKILSNARIRNAVLDAISDGQITEEEFLGILNQYNTNKAWFYKNKKLFKLEEDTVGLKKYSLSKLGKKIFDAVKKLAQENNLNEALKVPYPNPGNKPVNIFAGRFQPFTLGHVKVFEQMYKENGFPVVVLIVRSNKVSDKAPFSEDTQLAMFSKMKKEYPFLEAAYVVPNGGIDTLFAAVRPAYEPMLWGYGTDRKKSYDSMINKPQYREDLGVNPSFTGFEIRRGDEDISATKVREALFNNDISTFKKMTPKSLHDFFEVLQNNIKYETLKKI